MFNSPKWWQMWIHEMLRIPKWNTEEFKHQTQMLEAQEPQI